MRLSAKLSLCAVVQRSKARTGEIDTSDDDERNTKRLRGRQSQANTCESCIIIEYLLFLYGSCKLTQVVVHSGFLESSLS